jgi:hypothetical protein
MCRRLTLQRKDRRYVTPIRGSQVPCCGDGEIYCTHGSVALALALALFFHRVPFTLRCGMAHAQKSNAIMVNALLGIYSMSRL